MKNANHKFNLEEAGAIKIMVLGGCGAMGRAIVRDLMENPEVDQIIVGDVDLGKARAFVKELRSAKISAKKVDVTRHRDLVKALQGVNVVDNATWYEFNVDVMKACLKTHPHYLDLGGLYHITKKQLRLDRQFKRVGITAILGIGASPGITNVLAGYGASKLDPVDQVHIRTGAKGGGGFAYSAKTILDEVTMNSVGFSPTLVQKVNVLLELGLLSKRPVSIGKAKISAKDFLYAHLTTLTAPPSLDEFKSLQVEVVGKKNGESKTLTFETVVKSSEKWNLRATAIWRRTELN